tara:strand:+ start:254 stop:475 length:222 start_codon:yes stop_codon:yes gene_type:complete
MSEQTAVHRVQGLTLDQWMADVDQVVTDRLGISVHDLADFCAWDAWNDGMSPEDGAEMAMEGDDVASAYLDLL